MAETTQVTAESRKLSVVSQIKNTLEQENVKRRFQDVLGPKAPQFMASLMNVVNGTPALKQCEPNSIMAAAFVAASLDLPIDSNLGFAALVPYDKNTKDANGEWHKTKMAQFQIMYKGFVQLAIRSGEYSKMSCSEVYEDELISFNPITGECEFIDDFSNCQQRIDGERDKIVGYYAWFRLCSGFQKELYMSRKEMENHAKRYSQAYRYDLQQNKQGSKWSTDFDAMAKKTVIKQLLSKWGILSVQMQQAIQDDQKMYDEEGNESYGDNQPDVDDSIDPFAKALKERDSEAEEIDIMEL